MSARENRKQAPGSGTHGDDLRRALEWVLNDHIFDEVKLHGNTKWTAMTLVRLAIFWVWSPESSLVVAANSAMELVTRIFGGAAVGSYQGLTNALQGYSYQLLPPLWYRLHSLMEKCDEDHYRVGRWLALAMDGSRVGVPRTWKNEQRFCKPARKKKKKKKQRSRHAQRTSTSKRKKSHYDPQPVGPQMWLTMVWHIGLNLPWCWKIGPSYSSERAHVLEILAEQKFPANTLFCGDAGFCGYDFWREMATRGHHFLVRVGANVRLLKRLGYVREHGGIVYCWPDAAAKKKLLPLRLRLFHFQDRRGDVYLVTNVLDSRALTDAQASEIYRRRWGIELQFRAVKQTFGRSKLRSRTPDNAEVELNWSLMGLWLIQLLCLKEQTTIEGPDRKASVAAAIRIFRKLLNSPSTIRPPSESLAQQLAEATTDNYYRTSKKKSRNFPRRKEEPATGHPKVQLATPEQNQRLCQIQNLRTAL